MLEDMTRYELDIIEYEARLNAKHEILAQLLKNAANSSDPVAALEFLSMDPGVKKMLGNDKNNWNVTSKKLYDSCEGWGQDIGRGIIATAPAAALHATGVGMLMGPAGFFGALAGWAGLFGIASIIHACTVRVGRYKKILQRVKSDGLDPNKIIAKNRYSQYLPLYQNFNADVKRVIDLKNLVVSAIKDKNPDPSAYQKKMQSLGIAVFDSGKVKGGAHTTWADMDNSKSIREKGWDEKKLMAAVNTCLKLIDDMKVTNLSKQDALDTKQMSGRAKKMIKSAYKEMSFWLLDLIRGVAIAVKQYKK